MYTLKITELTNVLKYYAITNVCINFGIRLDVQCINYAFKIGSDTL